MASCRWVMPFIGVGKRSASPSTISKPERPPPTWPSLLPWKCTWYQYVPTGWSGGSVTTDSSVVPGLNARKMLSERSRGDTWSPW